jgi:predicted nuclease of restriction endonuclease-like (RecB) superfamily
LRHEIFNIGDMELAGYKSTFEVGSNVYAEIKGVLLAARSRAYTAVNFAMVEAYWQIGHRIVESQGNESRAEYGTQLLKYLSVQLTRDLETYIINHLQTFLLELGAVFSFVGRHQRILFGW